MAPPSSTPLRVHPDVIARRVGDGAVLVHVTSGRVFELNSTGIRVWELLTDGRNRAAIIASIEDEFAADAATVAADVEALIDELTKRGLLTE